jgi:hypothetical protein
MANLVHSPHSVSLETHIEGCTKRPADVSFTPKPFSFKKPPPQPISLVAIDITITRSPTPASTTPTTATATSPPPARPAPSETTLKMAHQDAETSKLYCHQYSSPGITSAQQVQFFLDKNIARLPFSVNPFLGLGPFAHHLLYDQHNKAPLKPTPTYPTRPHQAAKRALDLALAISTNILGTATKHFKTLTAHQQLPLSPTSWATHTLALNASTALAHHISRAISIIHKSQPTQTTPPTQHP